jgi:SAM-dependent methyltransferase
MNGVSKSIDELSPQQRAILELRLMKKRRIDTLLPQKDEENLVLAESIDSVDQLLAKFYGRFPWPWRAMKFDYLEDADFETTMINQDLGDWRHETIPGQAKVWVAGCGTNQAIHTALRFRNANVRASDVSTKSLSICQSNARALGLVNLELREESINHVPYRGEFDYVVCTGVIHHNADPQATLEKLSAALKPSGILELMVYNRYHRIVTSSFQKAIRIFGEEDEAIDFDAELGLAKKLINNVSVKDILERAFIQYMDWAESDLADLLIQPVEHSYTVESLEELADRCGLELVAPCISMYAKNLATIDWNLQFADDELRDRYYALSDSRRWQVTNLLLHEKSPLLWFYFQRKDAGRPRKSEKQICEEFLETRFERVETTQRSYLQTEDGNYRHSPTPVPYPMVVPDESVREIYKAIESRLKLREVIQKLGIEPTFQTVNQIRLHLTTSAFPYLRAIAAS